MQTTLLGLAIAFILALVAALVGPYFIDWNQFRPQFEAEATRVIGAARGWIVPISETQRLAGESRRTGQGRSPEHVREETPCRRRCSDWRLP